MGLRGAAPERHDRAAVHAASVKGPAVVTFIYCVWVLAFEPPMNAIRSWTIVLLAFQCFALALGVIRGSGQRR